MSFFDFLKSTTRYAGSKAAVGRLDLRREFLVAPYLAEINGARVLDLGSHDGRWSYALAAAGAREVVGIEARPELIAQFGEYPANAIRSRISFIEADVFEELPAMVDRGEKFEVVAIFGFYYHIMDHYRLLKLVARLEPKLVVIDGEFATYKQPMIKLMYEDTRKFLNTIPHVKGQQRAPIGIPSHSAMEMMAESLGYTLEWADWYNVPPEKRKGLEEYYRDPKEVDRKRGTCALRPG